MENDMIKKSITHIIDNYKNDRDLKLQDLTSKFHINKIRTITETIMEKNYPNLIMEKINNSFIEKNFIVAYLIYMEQYHNDIRKNFERIDNIPNIEQRTPEWYAIRNEYLSASSLHKVLGTENAKRELVYEKIGISKEFISCDATVHGTIFEEVSQQIYETRNGVKISEYGCLPHETYSFIGASPDGAVHDINNIDMFNIDYKTLNIENIHDELTVNSIALFGNLLEIKNPYTRKITNSIKPEYQTQITTQQAVCKLYKCDFLENNYNYYNTQEDFMNDIFDFEHPNVINLTIAEQNNYVKNHNIPTDNINSEGVEKGILLKFKSNQRNSYKGTLFDIKTPYTLETINAWISENKESMNLLNYELVHTYYWSVKTYSVKECGFNNQDWDTLVNKSSELWERIIEERLLSDKEVVEKYCKLQAIDGNVSIQKRKNTNYEARNLEKKPRYDQRQMTYNF
jgi:putative phage-type endonuclease